MVACVHQHEAACTVGVFCHAGCEACLAEQCALLVARNATYGNRGAKELGLSVAELAARRPYLGKHGDGYVHKIEQVGVPVVSAYIEQHGARGIADIGQVLLAAGQVPDQPAIDGSKGQLSVFGLLAKAGIVLKKPLQFGGRKVSIGTQSGFFLNFLLMALAPQFCAQAFAATVLPDNGPIYRLAAAAVPDHRRFALIGDADCADVLRLQAGCLQGLSGCLQLGFPDFNGVVLDPAGVRIVLGQLFLSGCQAAAAAVEDNAAGA